MKVSPIAAGDPRTVNPNEGSTASPDKLARAKAIAVGEAPADRHPPDPQVEKVQNSLKRIKMKTQLSQNRHLKVEEPVVDATDATKQLGETAPIVENTAPSDQTAITEQAVVASEDTKPLSPQFAALAKQKRALQLKEQEILAKEKALETQSGGMKSLEEYRARIKANALSVLMEEGVTYDQLTEQILATNQDNVDLSALKSEIQALKDDLNAQKTSTSERDAATEQQVLAQIKRDADSLIAQGDDFEMIREAGYGPKVVELIHKTFKTTGELLDTQEAASLIEKELLEESLKFAKIKKVQSRLNPTPPPQQKQPAQTDRPNTKIMRTLTNRDGVSSTTMSKRERAIAAMEGRLK